MWLTVWNDFHLVLSIVGRMRSIDQSYFSSSSSTTLSLKLESCKKGVNIYPIAQLVRFPRSGQAGSTVSSDLHVHLKLRPSSACALVQTMTCAFQGSCKLIEFIDSTCRAQLHQTEVPIPVVNCIIFEEPSVFLCKHLES